MKRSRRPPLRNTSVYDTEAVEAIVRWALARLRPPVTSVTVTNTVAAVFRGRAWEDGRILVRLASPAAFPWKRDIPFRRGAPAYELEDWTEALVQVLGHEAAHLVQMGRGERADEAACERAGVALLEAYRRARPRVEGRILRSLSMRSAAEARAAARRDAAEARADLVRARRELAAWEARARHVAAAIARLTSEAEALESRIRTLRPRGRGSLALRSVVGRAAFAEAARTPASWRTGPVESCDRYPELIFTFKSGRAKLGS